MLFQLLISLFLLTPSAAVNVFPGSGDKSGIGLISALGPMYGACNSRKSKPVVKGEPCVCRQFNETRRKL